MKIKRFNENKENQNIQKMEFISNMIKKFKEYNISNYTLEDIYNRCYQKFNKIDDVYKAGELSIEYYILGMEVGGEMNR